MSRIWPVMSRRLRQPPRTSIPQGAIDDPRGYLINALTQQMLSEPYRASMTQVTPDQTLSYTVEFQPPDRFHMVMPNVVEGIIIGRTMYLLQDGQWLQVPLEDDYTSAFGLLGPGAADIFDTIQNVQFGGADLLNGTPTLIFTYTTNATFGGIKPPAAINYGWVPRMDASTRSIRRGSSRYHSTTTACMSMISHHDRSAYSISLLLKKKPDFSQSGYVA